jgi:Tfp pilus assembly protein PilO
MNKKINLDLISLKFIFNKNKSYIFPIITILVCIIVFFQFVIPQFNALLAVREEVKELSSKLKISKENLNLLINIDESTLDSQLETLSQALPLSKDVVQILNSVYSSAQKTGVNLGSFSFSMGDLSKSENSDNFPVVRLSVPINAGVAAVSNFIEVMSRAVPLSDVDSVKINNMSASVSLAFYYKPLGSSVYNPENKIIPISQRGLTLISQLNEFKREPLPLLSQPQAPVATSSATQ